MGGTETESIGTPLECFWEACDTDSLSLQFVRESIASLPKVSDEEFVDSLQNYSLLHRICANERVSLEIVEEILRFYPDAVKITETEDWFESNHRDEHVLPLHVACENGYCPLSVIKLLVEKYPAALRHVGKFGRGLRTNCYIDEDYTVGGTPLSYYLDRRTNLTLEGVEFLVEACPEALKMSDKDEFFIPLYTLAINPTLSERFDVVQYLIRSEPSLPGMEWDDEVADLPLHLACRTNCGVSLEIVKFLVESWPDSLNYHEGGESRESLLHCLCQNKELDDSTAVDILKYLVQEDPGRVREHSNGLELLPLHCAAGEGRRSRAFCEYLVDQYPESLRIGDTNNDLPFHHACTESCLDVVKYLYEACPEALGARTNRGFFPVHEAIFNGHQRSEIIDFLLSVDPGSLSKRVVSADGYRFDGNLPLHVLAELQHCPDPVAGGKYLFDAYPESLLAKNDLGLTPVNLAVAMSHSDHDRRRSRRDLLPFLETQHQYALKAEKIDELTALDEDGRLLLHRAILDEKASLGSIKLLVRGNPNSVQVRDNNEMLPAHLACSRSSPDIVQYLLEQDESVLCVCDSKGDNLLHLACRIGNSGAAKWCPSLASSENNSGLLPLHLLCDKSGKDDGVLESVEYTEAIWQLLLAEPATLLSAISDAGKSINGKRKRGSEDSV